MVSKSFTITKKIAKHGKQEVIVVPKLLEEELKPILGSRTKEFLDLLN
jgi:hypothetical protein